MVQTITKTISPLASCFTGCLTTLLFERDPAAPRAARNAQAYFSGDKHDPPTTHGQRTGVHHQVCGDQYGFLFCFVFVVVVVSASIHTYGIV